MIAIENKIYNFIESFVEKKGYAPTYKNIEKELSLSHQTVCNHIKKMEHEGYIECGTRGQYNSIIGVVKGERKQKENGYNAISPELRKIIKNLVYDYDEMREKIRRLNLISSLSVNERPDGSPRGTGVSNPTERIAIKKLTTYVSEKKIVGAIDNAIESDFDGYNKLIWKFTTNPRYTIEHFCMYFPISSGTLNRKVNLFYYRIAKALKVEKLTDRDKILSVIWEENRENESYKKSEKLS